MGKLTALKIKAAKDPGRYQDGRGLMLLVKPSGSRSWILRIQVDGKRREFGLGALADVGLAEAREKADQIRKEFRAGVDPVAKKKAAKLARLNIPTFRLAAESTHEEHKGNWRNEKHREDWLSSLRLYAFPTIGETRVDQITSTMIHDVLAPIWLTRPETARRVRQRIRTIMGWAAAKEYCQPLNFTVINDGLPKLPKRGENHFAAMDYEKVPAFVEQLRSAQETNGRLALLFTIYTAARSGETRGATWAEIALEAKEWRIPAARMKAGREHVVPLSEPALAVLERAKALNGCKAKAPLFPGRSGNPVSDMTLTKILRDMELPVTVHGFRSSFKDWAAECTKFPDAVSEKALAHIDTDKTRRSYRRTDFQKMRVDLMKEWAAYLEGKPAEVARIEEARQRKNSAA
jgi:integrase